MELLKQIVEKQELISERLSALETGPQAAPDPALPPASEGTDEEQKVLDPLPQDI